jgi:gluconolactonase
MYAVPPDLPTRVFARVPDQYRIHGRSSRWIDVIRRAPTDCFLEGPSFDREGHLYVVDVAWGRVFRVSPDAHVQLVTEYDGEPNGLKIHRDGRIFIADFRRGIMLLDPNSGRVTPLLESADAKPFKGVNDLVFASNGDLYFTDQGLTGLQDPTGRLFRLRAGGKLDLLLDCIPSPNGLVLSADETSVFVNVTRANSVWRVPLLDDGTPYKVGEFIRLSGGGGPMASRSTDRATWRLPISAWVRSGSSVTSASPLRAFARAPVSRPPTWPMEARTARPSTSPSPRQGQSWRRRWRLRAARCIHTPRWWARRPPRWRAASRAPALPDWGGHDAWCSGCPTSPRRRRSIDVDRRIPRASRVP